MHGGEGRMMMCEMMLKAIPVNAGLNMRAQSRRGEKTDEQTSLLKHRFFAPQARTPHLFGENS
jgi:hypothetical protein